MLSKKPFLPKHPRPGLENVRWEISPKPVPYGVGMEEMESSAQCIVSGQALEQVWLLEHEPVYTLGSSGVYQDILIDTSIPVIETGRGGQATYHGPGQRVGYVLLKLRSRGLGPRDYVQILQLWLQEALNEVGVQTHLRKGRIGLWVEAGVCGLSQESKLVAIGVRIQKGVTLHGFAINRSLDLQPFQGIVPCGLSTYGVTSLKALGVSIQPSDLDEALYQTFSQFFQG